MMNTSKQIKYYLTTLLPKNILLHSQLSCLNVNDLARKYGFTETELSDPFGWVEVDPTMAMFKEIGENNKISNIGFHIGSRHYHPSHWSIGGYAMDTTDNMESLFELILALTNGNKGDSHLIAGFYEEDKYINYYLRPTASLWDNLLDYVEYWMAQTFHVIQSYMGTQIQAVDVMFQHSMRGSQEEYERFFGSAVTFDEPVTRMRIPAEWKKIVGPKKDDLLNQTLLQLVTYYVKAYHIERPYTEDVRIVLEQQLNRNELPTLETVANDMCASGRNLQRKLNAEGSSFSDIWDDVRKYHATMLLRNAETPIGSISSLLGYKNSSAFHTAFKRWTGETPKEYQLKYARKFTGKSPLQNKFRNVTDS